MDKSKNRRRFPDPLPACDAWQGIRNQAESIFETKKYEKAKKGTWRMPWLSQAMKDVISCDNPRVGANGH